MSTLTQKKWCAVPKRLIRVLRNENQALWMNDMQRDRLRRVLNDEGFYVLTRPDDALEVYVIEYPTMWTI